MFEIGFDLTIYDCVLFKPQALICFCDSSLTIQPKAPSPINSTSPSISDMA